MKKILFYTAVFFSIGMMAQENEPINTNSASFELGEGLHFNFDENNYQFKISGFIQPSFMYSKMNQDAVENEKGEAEFNAKRTYFNLSGKALKEKVSFFIQTDFSLASPLLDAWVAYHPTENLSITVGQKRTFTNNREMDFDEDKLQFTDRSMLSSLLSNSGREFGLFLEGKFSVGEIKLVPQLALTSGDGRNSFGTDSRDADKGGLKYGGRLDIYPLGYFSEGNQGFSADLMHENTPKIVIGAAASYNDGTSNAVGEGHDEFTIYDENGEPQLPDYRKVYADIIIKYHGFSLLGEYANASATGLEQTFVNEAGNVALQPQQIGSYLALGDAANVQLGYATLSGYALDLRYATINPEFANNADSILQDTEAYTLGLSKYFKNNSLKLQTAFSSIKYENADVFQAELILQVVF